MIIIIIENAILFFFYLPVFVDGRRSQRPGACDRCASGTLRLLPRVSSVATSGGGGRRRRRLRRQTVVLAHGTDDGGGNGGSGKRTDYGGRLSTFRRYRRRHTYDGRVAFGGR